MSRALSMRHTIVPSAERADFRARARRAQAHYAGAGCRYWLFEESSLPGAYLEFFEAGDADALARAHRGAPDPPADAARMYVEVELT
jgi:hypothetical protein